MYKYQVQKVEKTSIENEIGYPKFLRF